MTSTDTVEVDLADLTGQVVGTGHPDYDAARSVYNGMIDKSPALIAQVRTEADVALAVNVARQHGLLLGRPRRRPQRGRTRHLRRRAGHRPRRPGFGRGGPGRQDGDRRRRLHLGSGGQGDRRVRTGDPEWDRLHDRRRWPHPRRWTRPPDPCVRTDHRQPARGGRGPGRRAAGAGQCGPRSPTCSGPCAAAAATSGWSPRSRSS